jgi:SAM-dependent methyltransferase
MFMTDPASGQSNNYFDSAYSETPPWDIGKPQPDLITLLEEFPPSGPILEVGCGAGDLSIALARRGLRVLGMDSAEPAIAQARTKAASDPSISGLVEFRVGDALHPETQPGPFAAVIDSGFFHLFSRPEREQLARALATTLANGGHYYLLGFAFDSPVPNAPRQVSDSELKELFAPELGWRILVLRSAKFVVRMAPQGVPAIAACIERVTSG